MVMDSRKPMSIMSHQLSMHVFQPWGLTYFKMDYIIISEKDAIALKQFKVNWHSGIDPDARVAPSVVGKVLSVRRDLRRSQR